MVRDVALEPPGILLDPVPAEAAQIVEAGMGADGHSPRQRGGGGLDHDVGIARMEAAGDIGRGDDVEERGVVAHAPGPKPSPRSALRSMRRALIHGPHTATGQGGLLTDANTRL